MSKHQELRSEETKSMILSAAGKLFAKKGFNAVTMREIAKEAGCSHTTIYIYFKDKEALLHQLSMPPLQQLYASLQKQLQAKAFPVDNLKAMSTAFIRFCLVNRDMYMIFFGAKPARVDDENPELEINKLRNAIFGLLKLCVQQCLQLRQQDEQLLTFTRIYFFTLQGIVSTYTLSQETRGESIAALMSRLASTFDEAFEILLLGFQQKLKKGVE